MSHNSATTKRIIALTTLATIACFWLAKADQSASAFSLTAAIVVGVVTYEHAEQLRENGFSVIPLKPSGKAPAMPWSEFCRRLAELAELRQWWGPNVSNSFNIGVVCGQISRIMAIDADSREAAIQLFRRLPRTPLMSKTGKGVHFLYRLLPKQIVTPRVRAYVKRVLCDIRGERSFVVAPPSTHPNGQPYEWVNNLADVDLNDVPYFESSWIESASSTEQREARIFSPLKYIQTIVAKSGEGGHNTTYRCACILRDAGLSEAEALAAMVEWNKTNCVDAQGHPYLWTTKELLHKITDAYQKGGAA